MTDTKTRTAELILSTFKGRDNWIAYHKPNAHFKPHELKTKQVSLPKFVSSHFGDTCLGFYLMRDDDTVHVSCLDYDDHDGDNSQALPDAMKAYTKLIDAGFSPLLEISQSGKGCHVWLVFNEPISAGLVRKFWKTFLETENLDRSTEVYPRQDSLKGKKLGNLIRYPLFNKSVFATIEDGALAETPALQALTSLILTDKAMLENACSWLEEEEEAYDETIGEGCPVSVASVIRENPVSILAKRWQGDAVGLKNTTRSTIACAITTELIRAFVPTEDIKQGLRYWCKKIGYYKGDRPKWINLTVASGYELIKKGTYKKAISANTFHSIAMNYLDQIRDDSIITIPYGIPSMDKAVEPMRHAELIVIAGRPGHGKTAFSTHIADNISTMGHNTLFISREMSPEQLGRRTIKHIVEDIPESEWKSDDSYLELKKRLNKHYLTKGKATIFYTDPGKQLTDVEACVERHVNDYNVSLVVLDYLGLVTANKYNKKDDQAEVVQGMKAISKRYDVTVIALAQLNRGDGKKRDVPFDLEFGPTFGDLKDTGALEEEADYVLGVSWNWKFKPSDYLENEYRIWFLKSRSGEIKYNGLPYLPLNINKNTLGFSDWDSSASY